MNEEGAEKKDNNAISIPNDDAKNNASTRGPVTVENYRNIGGSSPAVDFLSKFMHTSNLDDNQNDLRQASWPRRTSVGKTNEGDIIQTSKGDLVVGRSIGRGTFSECRMGFLIEKRLNVNVKIVSKTGTFGSSDEGEESEEGNKWKMWQSLKHPNILPLEQVIDRNDGFLYLITPLATETLLSKLQRDGKLDERLAKCIFKQLVRAVRYLHLERGFVHGDIKLENILLKYQENDVGSEEVACWLTDFDFICPKDQFTKQTIYLHRRSGSLTYLPPVNRQGKLSEFDGTGDDIWALGIVLFAMLFGELPKPPHEIVSDIIITDTSDHIDVASRLVNARGDYADLLRGILEPDPGKRFSIEQILTHIWLN